MLLRELDHTLRDERIFPPPAPQAKRVLRPELAVLAHGRVVLLEERAVELDVAVVLLALEVRLQLGQQRDSGSQMHRMRDAKEGAVYVQR